MYGFVSSDALSWRRVTDGFIIEDQNWVFDTRNIAFWLEMENQYLLYYRKTIDNVRMIARAVSDDFIHRRKAGLIDFKDQGFGLREQFYTNQIAINPIQD